jgi:hypothetical protein
MTSLEKALDRAERAINEDSGVYGKLPSEVFNKPVIGRVVVKSPFDNIEVEDDVIEKTDKVYVINRWYKEYKKVPQFVPAAFVVKFTPSEK